MKKVATFLLVVFLFCFIFWIAGCKASKPTTSTLVKDSTYTTLTEKLVPVLIPADSLQISFQVECDPKTNLPRPASTSKKSVRAQSSVTIDSIGRLQANCLCDKEKAMVKVLEKEVNRLRAENKASIEYKTRPTGFIDWFCRIVTLSLLLFIAYNIYGQIKK